MKKQIIYDMVVVGGGASGFFHAINYKIVHPNHKVIIIEKSNKTLAKVKISGGGRCNVTHACFEPKELVKFYPRGNKELIGPFHQFQPGDTIGWFADRGVGLKVEDDGRMFPDSDSSQTIIDCFESDIKRLNIDLVLHCALLRIGKKTDWQLETSNGILNAKRVYMAAGSSPSVWRILENLGLKCIPPVPSLFTFKIKDARLTDLLGVSVPHGRVKLLGVKGKFEEYGPVLITHWGLSGPGILKLSARAAIELAKANYNFNVEVSFNNQFDLEDTLDLFKDVRQHEARSKVVNRPQLDVPKRLWLSLVRHAHISDDINWADLSNKKLEELARNCSACVLNVTGKSTFKEEFVTAGGVDLKEIDFKTMEAKRFPGLYFGGEVLNIDALTGGYNFQAAWTTAWIAAQN